MKKFTWFAFVTALLLLKGIDGYSQSSTYSSTKMQPHEFYSPDFRKAHIANSQVASQPDEYWWGGAVEYAYKSPFGINNPFSFELYGDVSNNQSAPLLISSKGKWVWCDEPFKYSFSKKDLTISGSAKNIYHGVSGTTLAEAYRYLSKKYFPPSGKWIDTLLITAPQYNLWIELLDNPTQEKVMNYAKKILQEGYPAGVLMIDNRWENYHGIFEFDRNTFPHPKQMMDSLHAMGFKVMLWICPFVSPDSKTYKTLVEQKCFVLDNEGYPQKKWDEIQKPLIVQWWDGYSTCLDLSNPDAKKWLQDKLDHLQSEYGVDGFKFDAGDPYFYNYPNAKFYQQVTPNDQCQLWAEAGLKYPLNEYRAMWKMGGQPLVQRLSDKGHDWKSLQRLIPNTITQQLLGYTFTCPDMIGGGLSGSFNEKTVVDQALFVRSAQCHALMPMMQFSAAPWRVLDQSHQEIVKKVVALRKEYLPIIMDAIRKSVQTGEPALKPLEYLYPHQGYHNIQDQFFIGDDLMVAPVVTPENTRQVVLPKGSWRYKDQVLQGGVTKTIDVPLDEIPVFIKVK